MLAFIVWPATFVSIMATADAGRSRNVFDKRTSPDSTTGDIIQTILELAKRGPAGSGQELGQMREMIERYAGLLDTSRGAKADPHDATDLYRAAGHPDPVLAAAVYARLASAKLQRHRLAASAEVRQFFANVTDHSVELRTAVAALARGLGDFQTASALAGNVETDEAADLRSHVADYPARAA
jgi:hypothetical protein